MKKKSIDWIWQIGLAALVFGIDRAVKAYINASFQPGEVFGKIPFVADFCYVRNTGAAFSMLSENTFLLTGLSFLFLVAIAVYKIVRKPHNFMENLAVVLFFAGGLGNAADRVMYKYVVDFIELKWFDFPIFNIADMAIVGGAIAAILYVLFFDKDKTNE